MLKRWVVLLVVAVLIAPLALALAQRGDGTGGDGGRGDGQGGGMGRGGGAGAATSGEAGGHGDGGVRHFGAVGDGVADDADAIQKAVDSAVGDIKFPPGVFRITRPIVVDLDRVGFTSFVGRGTARIVMAGPGPAIKFVGTHAGTADPHTMKDNIWARQRMPRVDSLEIVGDHAEAIGIQATGTVQLTINDVLIRRVLHGIHLIELNRNVIISDCHIYENRGVGVFLDGVNLHQFNIGSSHVSYNAAGGIVVRDGNVRNIHIGACDIEGNFSPEGPATANVLFDCTGGSVAEVAITGCTIQHTGASPESANIRFLGRDAEAKTDTLRENRYGNLTIAGNVLSDVQYNIDLDGVRTASITGNTLWKGYTHSIRVVDSSNVVFGANVLDRNPRYYGQEKSNDGVLFRGCRDCTVSGLHLLGNRNADAALLLENCRRMNVSDCTILDCEGAGLVLRDVADSIVSSCLIRDDRDSAATAEGVSLRVTGGRGNLIVDNRLGGKVEIDAASAREHGNYRDDDSQQ
jgi:hypothetical protein